MESAETGQIRPDRIGQDKGITPVILGSRDTVTIPKPVKLLGMNRKDGEASLDQPVHNGATWHCDGHGDALRVAC